MNTKITPGRLAFAIIAVLAAVLFVRLGFWQLGRHAERRDALERRESRLAEPPVESAEALLDLSDPGSSDEALKWRRVRLSGRWDFENEVVVRNRALDGRPGVHVVTPLRLAGRGGPVAVLVLRGWLPAPDAMTPGPIAAPDTSATGLDEVEGVLRASRDGLGEPMLPSGEGADQRPSFAAVDVGAIEDAVDGSAEYLPVFVQRLPRGEAGGIRTPGAPIPVPLPEAGAGPHMAYAIQWFAFALIALMGSGAFLLQEHRRTRPNSTSGRPRPG